MLSFESAQVFVGITYLALAVALGYGRPPAPKRGASGETSPARTGSRVAEAVWLGSIAFVLLYPVGALVAPGTILAPPWAFRFPGDAFAQVAGMGLILAGAALVGTAFRALGRFATVEIRLVKDHRIVRTGPYARIRHPMYTANMLLSLGVSLAFLGAVTWVAFGLIAILAVYRSRTEEALFLSSPAHGQEYALYLGETGRFLPRLTSLRSARP